MKKFSLENYYKKFEKLCSLSYLGYLNGSAEFRLKQKSLFLGNKIKNPVFDYPDLEKTGIEAWKKELISLKEDIVGQENNTVLKRVCLEKVENKITETKILRSFIEKDETGFLENNFKLYGKPSRKLYNFCIGYFRDERFNENKLNKYLNVFEKNTRNEIDEYLDNISLEGSFDQEKIKEIFNKVIKHTGFGGWKAEISTSSRVGFILDHDKKMVVIPQGKTLAGEKLKGLISHEIGVHLLRRIRGEKLGNPLFYLGLPGYERGEEGVGTLKEMALERKGFNPDHIVVALGICFALGYEKNIKKDFRSVFENILGLIISSQKNLSEDEAKNKAWNMCSRIFAVPDWKPEGLCLTRDYIYLDGVLRILDLIDRGEEKYLDLKIGKYDPANKEHIKIAKELSLV
jgi:hypothetical protein